MTREEAKEILTHNWTRVDNPNYSESELDEAFFMAIEALTDRPKGEWISKNSGYWKCSECGIRVAIYGKGNFCPNCGADMRGGTE